MKSFKTFLLESEEVGYLYHATYGKHLKSIAKHGLGGNQGKKNWDNSKKNVVYLAKSASEAHSYADGVRPYFTKTHVLKVHKRHLDPKKLHADTNDGTPGSYEYHGVIHPDHIEK